MNKIFLIIKREYITRVRNKTFILSTFLLPIMLILFIAGSVYFATKSKDKLVKLAIVNAPAFIQQNLQLDSSKVIAHYPDAITRDNYASKGFDGVLILNTDTSNKKFVLQSKKTMGVNTIEYLNDQLDKAFQNRRLQNLGIKLADLDSASKNKNGVSFIENNVEDDKGKSAKVSAGLNSGIGFGCGILIYLTMFIFGAMVMRGVMEEKTNRIAEVMISSVKPFQLMMGKIIGIGAVGLTQLLLWIVLIFGLSTAAQFLISPETMSQVQQLQNNPALSNSSTFAASEAARNIYELKSTMVNVPWAKIIGCFIFYFIGGYLFYSSLFAAIGSVINEDPQEAQSLMLPITMPIVFGFILLSSNINTPDSSAMFWGSMIPFTSPIVMMGRIANNPPVWQIALSMLLLVGGFLFTTWLAGKIYRTGILMYGKKASWKEMFKWAFRKS